MLWFHEMLQSITNRTKPNRTKFSLHFKKSVFTVGIENEHHEVVKSLPMLVKEAWLDREKLWQIHGWGFMHSTEAPVQLSFRSRLPKVHLSLSTGTTCAVIVQLLVQYTGNQESTAQAEMQSHWTTSLVDSRPRERRPLKIKKPLAPGSYPKQPSSTLLCTSQETDPKQLGKQVHKMPLESDIISTSLEKKVFIPYKYWSQ